MGSYVCGINTSSESILIPRGALSKTAIHLTFIELPFVIKNFILSIFEWPFYTGFTVHIKQDGDEKRMPKESNLQIQVSKETLIE